MILLRSQWIYWQEVALKYFQTIAPSLQKRSVMVFMFKWSWMPDNRWGPILWYIQTRFKWILMFPFTQLNGLFSDVVLYSLKKIKNTSDFLPPFGKLPTRERFCPITCLGSILKLPNYFSCSLYQDFSEFL